MKTKLNILVVLILVVVTFGQRTTTYAADSHHSRGRIAIATFISTVDCIYTETAVTASESRDRIEPGAPERSAFAAVSIVQYDTCTETLLHFAYGDSAPLLPEEFQVSNTLDSATLNTTINVFDEASGGTFDVFIDLTWTATAPVRSQHSHEHFHTPGCIVNANLQRNDRMAQATGTISDGTTNFTLEPSVDGVLVSAKSSSVVIGCTDG
jgi:hypothetical protein